MSDIAHRLKRAARILAAANRAGGVASAVSVGVGPIQAAMAKFGERTAVGSALRSAEWGEMPLAFRERAFFSSGVKNVRALQGMQRELAADLAMERDESGGWRSRSTFIAKVRSMVQDLRNEAGGLRSDLGDVNSRSIGDPRSLTDLGSRARATLIYDMAMRSSAGYARWQNDNDPDILDAFPAQELVRVAPRLKPRDWESKWTEEGGRLIDGRMVALKTDPIWTNISRFGTPWPPFDYGSGMGLQDLDRAEAEDLGLVRPGDRLQPVQQEQFNASLKASVSDLSPEFKDALKNLFGPQIVFDGDSAKWHSDPDAYEQVRRQNDAESRGLYKGLTEALDGVGVHGDVPGLVAVASGNKALYHERFRSRHEAESFLRGIRSVLPQVQTHTVETAGQSFVFAWNPSKNSFTPEQIERDFASGGGGRELGYGTDRGAPGNLQAKIYDPKKTLVTGFEVPNQFGRLFAKARELDFTRATGKQHRYRLDGKGRAA